MAVKRYNAGNYTSSNIRCTIITECPACGQEFIGTVYCKELSWNEVSRASLWKIPKCHICGGEIFKNEAYSVWSPGAEADSMKEQLKAQIVQFESDKSRAEIEEWRGKIKPVDDMPADNDVVKKIKSNIPSLKTYIHQLIDLSVWSRFLEEYIVKLDEEKMKSQKNRIATSVANKKSSERKTATQEKRLRAEIDALKQEFESTDWGVVVIKPKRVVQPSAPKYLAENTPVKPAEPTLKQPNIFNKKKVLAENERLTKEYEQAVLVYEQELKTLEEIKAKNAALREKYIEDMQRYQERAQAEKQRATEEREKLESEMALKKQEAEKELKKKIRNIRKQIDKLDEADNAYLSSDKIETVLENEKDFCRSLLKTVWQAQNKLFSINVIYPNYRDVSALSSFFEYFNSERCYKLEGPEGTYNLYEAERRSDGFANFIRTVEDINKNQVVLYKELSAMFENLNSIVSELGKAVKAVNRKEAKKEEITDEIIEKSFKKYSALKDDFTNRINGAMKVLETYIA